MADKFLLIIKLESMHHQQRYITSQIFPFLSRSYIRKNLWSGDNLGVEQMEVIKIVLLLFLCWLAFATSK